MKELEIPRGLAIILSSYAKLILESKYDRLA